MQHEKKDPAVPPDTACQSLPARLLHRFLFRKVYPGRLPVKDIEVLQILHMAAHHAPLSVTDITGHIPLCKIDRKRQKHLQHLIFQRQIFPVVAAVPFRIAQNRDTRLLLPGAISYFQRLRPGSGLPVDLL